MLLMDRQIAAEVWADARPKSAATPDEPAVKRSLRRGKFNRRLIAEKTVNGIAYALHATKGWRARREHY